MARSSKCANHFHLGIGLDVGSVNNAEPRLAARDEGQRVADIVGLGELWFDAREDAERFERFLGVDSGWARADHANGDFAVSRGAREIETFCDLKLDIGVAGLDENKL